MEEYEIKYSDVIVAVDLGSRNIRGVIGHRDQDGKLDVLRAISVPSENSIVNGVVINIDSAALHIKRLIIRLRNLLNGLLNKSSDDPSDRVSYDITDVYVGLHGKSIHGEVNELSRLLSSETVSEEIVHAMEEENLRMRIDASRRIIDVVPSEYVVDGMVVDNPVGCVCDNLRARFLNVHAECSLMDNLRKCFDRINESSSTDAASVIKVTPHFVLSSRYLSDAVLSPEQKEVGCMLLDFGAQTTSLSIYHERKLRFLHVFNFGSDLITNDIATLRLPWDISEKLKTTFGQAMQSMVTSPVVVDLEGKREVDTLTLAGIIESRVTDFLARINSAMTISGYSACLDSIVVVGGGAKLGNMIEKIEKETGIPTRLGDVRVLSPNTVAVEFADVTYASAMGIMMAAKPGGVTIRDNMESRPKKNKKENKSGKIIPSLWGRMMGKMEEKVDEIFNEK
jgi:cell division protein FtsA